MNGFGELTDKLEIEERGTMETPVYLCGTHALGHRRRRGDPRLRARAPTTSSSPSSASATTGTWGTRGPSRAADVERALAALGTRRRGGERGGRDRDGLLRIPGRDRDRIASWSATTTSGCCCSATSASGADLDVLGTSLGPAPAARRSRGLVHHGLRHRRAARCRTSSGGSRCGRCLGSPARGPMRARARARSGWRSRPTPRGASRTATSTRYFLAAWEAAHEAVMNCLVAAPPGAAPRRDDAGRLPDRARPRAGRRRGHERDAALRDEVLEPRPAA